VYSWSAADPAANYDRTVIEEANRIQDKYNFMFDAKPGAGGAVAAMYVNNTSNTILATSSAFFIRPNFFPNQSHDINNYRELMPKCTAPFVITSGRYKSWKEVPTNAPLKIGVSGLGTTTHLVATQLIKKYPQMFVIPFKSTSEALISVISGDTDFAVGFNGDVESWTKDSKVGRVYVLGVTGMSSLENNPTLVSQGFDSKLGDMSSPNHYVVSTKFNDEKFAEVREILLRAAKAPSVLAAYKLDRCAPTSNDVATSNLQSWYTTQAAKWHSFSQGVNVN
jgi:tripartite-type tricarboxylate transporter receptor subunit TctC